MPKILLVEDNEMNRDMLSRRLSRRGYEVVIAVDGQQGCDMALSGWEATRRIKAAAATCALPVIGLTAHAMSGDREKAIEAGCDDYDTKPVELERLLAKIETLIHRAADAKAANAGST